MCHQEFTPAIENFRVTGGPMRFAILTELGRIANERAMRDWAAESCRRKPRAKNTIAMIRRWR
jgi:hypothetical protein